MIKHMTFVLLVLGIVSVMFGTVDEAFAEKSNSHDFSGFIKQFKSTHSHVNDLKSSHDKNKPSSDCMVSKIPNQPVPLRVPIKYLGVLQLVAHDIYNVDRTTGIDSEDGKLNLSTVLNHGYANIANGGEFRNMENPITFTVAKQFGQEYLHFISEGKSPEQARKLVLKDYSDAVTEAYQNTFFEKIPSPANTVHGCFDVIPSTNAVTPVKTTIMPTITLVSGIKTTSQSTTALTPLMLPVEKDTDLSGDLALRTLHDLVPGKIMVNGVLTSILDPSLVGKTLSKNDMAQLSSPLDGQYDPEFRDMVDPNSGTHIDLLERDSSFATQFHTKYTFEELLSELADGKYDPSDLVMQIIRDEFTSSRFNVQ